MRINVEQLEKMKIDFFDQILIKDDGFNNYSIELLSNNIKLKVVNLNDNNKLIELIQKYLDSVKVCGFTKLPPLALGTNDETVINCKNKKLRMKLYNPKIKIVSEMILNKYLNDRNEFFCNEDFKCLNLEFSSVSSMYEENEDNVRLVLKIDKYGNISKSEREFFEAFINYKFSLIGESLNIVKITKHNRNILGEDVVDKYIVQCGDFEIVFPNKFQFMILLNMIDSYSNENVKKRKR